MELGVDGSNPSAVMRLRKIALLKVKGLRRMVASVISLKAVWRKIVRQYLDAERLRERPEASYVFFLFATKTFQASCLGQ